MIFMDHSFIFSARKGSEDLRDLNDFVKIRSNKKSNFFSLFYFCAPVFFFEIVHIHEFIAFSTARYRYFGTRTFQAPGVNISNKTAYASDFFAAFCANKN